jgi:GAF domain-containing protein
VVVGDATRDDRFARDAYFRGVDGCSVLAVPVFSRGALRAVLVLENRLIRGAFSPDRLDVVRLIAGGGSSRKAGRRAPAFVRPAAR